MDRLRNQPTANGTLDGDAVALVRSYAPFKASDADRRRIRAALAASAQPRRTAWLRPVLAAGLVLVLTVTAGTSMGRTWVAGLARRIGLVHGQAPAPAAVQPQHRRAPVPDGLPAAPVPAEQPASAPAPASAVPPRQAPATVVSRHPPVPARAAGAPAQPTVAAHSAEDAGLVMAGMQALRSAGDPVKAGALLDQYLARHPRGALAEEALTLAIQAALARGDARAQALAAQYVRSYPNGAYRDTAVRVLNR